MYKEAQKHNLKKIKNKRYDTIFGKKLERIYVYKLKLYKTLIKKVFKFYISVIDQRKYNEIYDRGSNKPICEN